MPPLSLLLKRIQLSPLHNSGVLASYIMSGSAYVECELKWSSVWRYNEKFSLGGSCKWKRGWRESFCWQQRVIQLMQGKMLTASSHYPFFSSLRKKTPNSGPIWHISLNTSSELYKPCSSMNISTKMKVQKKDEDE